MELKTTQSQLAEQKQSSLNLAERKMKEFTSYTRCMFNETLTHLSDKHVVLSKMASINTEPLNDRIWCLHEQAALVMSLLDQSYINQDVFNRCRSEKRTLGYDSTENMWDVYSEFLLDQFLDASRLSPSAKDILKIQEGIRTRSSKFIVKHFL